MIRDRKEQLNLGVPQEFLDAHAWHTYKITANEFDTGLGVFSSALRNFLARNPVFKDFENSITGYKDNYFIERISKDKTVSLSAEFDSPNVLTLTHNINGRSVYVDGTLEALRFLRAKWGYVGRVYSMINVLDSLGK